MKDKSQESTHKVKSAVSRMKASLHLNNFLLLLTPLWLARMAALIMADTTTAIDIPLFPLARGFLSDLAVAVLAALLLEKLFNRKGAYYFLLATWAVLHALNVEHIVVNGANAQYAFARLAIAGDFIRGSLLSARVLGVACITLVPSLAILFAIERFRLPSLGTWSTAIITPLAFAVFVLPSDVTALPWMNRGLIEENVRVFIDKRRTPGDALTYKNNDYGSFLQRDLSGPSLIKSAKPGRNVLLVVIEGVSSNASKSEVMPFLKSLHFKGHGYADFVALQRQTNRGMYALLCGDYPNMISYEAKTDIISMHGPLRPCIPSILRENGYHTAYMQSAPLGYMNKDDFMKSIGFTEVSGDDSYEDSLPRGSWGIYDRTLFALAIKRVQSLEESESPWFLTLLTSGTHHPYSVPGSSSSDIAKAFAYADTAARELIEGLADAGVMENTLVIITSDESSILVRDENTLNPGLSLRLDYQHIPLFVFTPEGFLPYDKAGAFTQADIPISVMDYLGLSSPSLKGRSVFRSYDKGRNIIFGNALTNRFFSHSSDGTLYICDYDWICASFKPDGNSLFSSEYHISSIDKGYMKRLRSAVIRNEIDSRNLDFKHAFIEEGRSYKGNAMLLGGHNLLLNEGESVRWVLEVQASEEIDLLFFAQLVLLEQAGEVREIFNEEVHIEAGKTAIFEHTFTAAQNNSIVLSSAEVTSGQDARYLVKRLLIQRK